METVEIAAILRTSQARTIALFFLGANGTEGGCVGA
jgi:hypothetical protein